MRIKLQEDHDSISNKTFDLSRRTIESLITQGEKDTINILKRSK